MVSKCTCSIDHSCHVRDKQTGLIILFTIILDADCWSLWLSVQQHMVSPSLDEDYKNEYSTLKMLCINKIISSNGYLNTNKANFISGVLGIVWEHMLQNLMQSNGSNNSPANIKSNDHEKEEI